MAGKSLATVIDGALAEDLGDDIPVLAKRKRVEKRLEESQRKLAIAAAEMRTRRLQKRRGHVPLGARAVTGAGDGHDAVLESLMRQIATRGVVSLFNAVGEAQRRAQREDKKAAGDRTAGLSKDAFLTMLKQGTARGAAKQHVQPRAAFLRDDYDVEGDGEAQEDDDLLAGDADDDWDDDDELPE